MLTLALALSAQAAAPQAVESVLGEVAEIRAEGLVVRADAGPNVLVGTDERTALLRSRPGAKSLSEAVPINRSEIAVGDRVLARGTYGSDRAVLAASRLVVMKKDDIEVRREQEQAEWRRRGVGGVVTALDPAKREMTVRLRGTSDGPRTVLVRAGGREVVFHRYAPGSVRFGDARPGSYDELRLDDQVRMLGERSEDGSTFQPERIVSGAFRTVQGTVARVNAERSEIVVRTASDDGPPLAVTVTVGPDASLHRLRPDPPSPKSARVAASAAEGAKAAPVYLDEALARMPRIPLAQIVPGEQIAVLGTRSEDASRLNAIKLVAGLPAADEDSAEAHGERGERGGGEENGGSDRLGFGGELPW